MNVTHLRPRIVPKLSRALCSSAVIPKKPTEPLATFDRADSSRFVVRCVNETVLDPLVIALAVVVRDVLADRSSKMRFTDRNDLCQAFRFDRSTESLGVRVQIRATTWELHGTHSRTIEDFSEAL